jgi:hypothetical protein
VHVVDSSALVKLIVDEPGSEGFRRWFTRRGDGTVASAVAEIEVMRAVRRSTPDRAVAARSSLSRIELIEVTDEVRSRAIAVDPVAVRTLDAIHLATALVLGDECDGLVTYDQRLAEAAGRVGIDVIAP